MKKLILFMVILTSSFSAFAQDAFPGQFPGQAPIEPAFDFIKQLLEFLLTTFPKVGPYAQGLGEIIGAIAAFFTLATVFVQSVLLIPYLAARWAKAHELAEKIKAISEKVTPYLKYLSIFNATKK